MSRTATQLRSRPADRRGQRLLPAYRPEPRRRPPPCAGDIGTAPTLGRRPAALADERRPRRGPAGETDRRGRTRRSGRAAGDGRARPGSGRRSSRPRAGRAGPLHRAQGPDQQAEEGRLPDRARRSCAPPSRPSTPPRPARSEVLAHRGERTRDVEVVDADQLAAPGVEEHQLAEGEQLERAAESRARCRRAALATPAQPCRTRGCRRSRARSLSPSGTPADHHRRRASEAHVTRSSRKPNSRSAFSSLRQLRRTCTGQLEVHLDAEERLQLARGPRCRSA